jgi:hypothetical protein
MTTTNNIEAASSPALIALSWLVVLIPAAWGIYLTAMRAANLFH